MTEKNGILQDAGIRSKRAALRFRPVGYQVRFRTEFEDGEALVDNISAGGASLCKSTSPVGLQEKVLLILPVEGEDPYEVAGVTVRATGDSFAVKFTQITEETQERIVGYFARLQRESR